MGCGLLVALSLPPFGWWPLGIAGLAGFAGLLRSVSERSGRPARARAAVGAGVGLGQYVVGLWWVIEFNGGGYVALVVHGLILTALAAAVTPARRRWGLMLGFPAALLVADWVRGRFPFGGLPIGGAALGQAAGPLAPVARLGGTLLVTAVAAVAGAAVAEAAHFAWSRRRGSRSREPAVRGLAAVALVLLLVGAGRLAPNGGPALGSVRVALVQGGGPRGLRGLYVDPQTVLDRHLRATDGIRPPVDLVLWPEDVIQVEAPVQLTPAGSQLAAVAQRLQTTVVAGVVEDVGTNRFRNAAVAWSPTGDIVARYDKKHRVPFGEYIPGRSVFQHLANLDLVPRDAIPGQGPGILPTPVGPLGVVISYEVFFQDRARDAARAGGQVLLVPTNAASYSTSQVPTQEVAAAQLRAWETGRDTIQAAPTGYSAVIDRQGHVRARSVLGRQQILRATVERHAGKTVFVRVGELPFVAVAAAGLLVVLLAHWRPIRFGR